MVGNVVVSRHAGRFSGTRVLVTGAAGFLGSELVNALLALGARVTGFDVLRTPSGDIPPRSPDHVVCGSVSDREAVRNSVRGCELVFHLAADGARTDIINPKLRTDAIEGTRNVLDAAVEAGARRVVFASSCAVYADSADPLRESGPTVPASDYAAAKLEGEALTREYAGRGIDAVSLRYFPIFGPRQSTSSAYASVIPSMAAALMASRPPVIYGDGEQSRDLTALTNALHATLLAGAAQTRLDGIVVNVGTGSGITINYLARLLAQILNQPHAQPKFEPAANNDRRKVVADMTNAKQVLGYWPIVEFEAALRETVTAFIDRFTQLDRTGTRALF